MLPDEATVDELLKGLKGPETTRAVVSLRSCSRPVIPREKKMPDRAYHGRKFRDANGLKSSHNPSSEQAPGYASAVRRLAPD